MDQGYNNKDAAVALEQHAQERLQNPFGGMHLAEISKNANWMSNFEAIKEGAVWRLVYTSSSAGENTSTAEEVVASLQGIICQKDLPPFLQKFSASSSHARFLRQSISLTGLDSPTFRLVTQNIAEIHALFGRAVGADCISQCGIVSHFKDDLAVEISNRYFTPKNDVANVESIPLNQDIDPYGYLFKAGGTTLFYGAENVVNYYECLQDEIGGRKFVSTKPVKFQVGDIVEAQVSFLLLPLRDKTFKSSMILRSLALLDGSYTQKATVSRLCLNTNPKVKSVLKRQVGYEAEEMASTRFRFSQLTIESTGISEEEHWQALLDQVEPSL